MSNLMRYVLQDAKLHKGVVISLLGVVPLVMVISVLPVTFISFATWSTLHEFIRTFRFEFFYGPLFILLFGSLYNSNDWIRLRRYERRKQIADHLITMVMSIAGIFAVTVFVGGGIISLVIKFIVHPHFPAYHAMFQYQPEQTEEPSVVWFFILFYLVSAAVGMLYVLFREWTNHHALAALIAIFMIVVDKFTVSLIPMILYLGYENFPLQSTGILIAFILLLLAIARLQIKQKDFYSKDEPH